MLDFIIRTFLSALVQTQDSTLRDWVTSSLLERLLGSSLIRNTVTLAKGASRIKKDLLFSLIIDNTDRELTTAPLESSVRFFVIVEGKRLIVVDVLELTIRIADNALQTSASAKSK